MFHLMPLVWQRFFALYLQRPVLSDSNMPERSSMGLRFFSTGKAQSLRKQMKAALSSICKAVQKEIDELQTTGVEGQDEKDLALKLEYLPKCLSYYKTLKLWLEEPKIHDDTIYLPGLPPQYDSERLTKVFRAKQEDWIEFIKIWEVASLIKLMIKEWGQVITYQKPLPSETEVHNMSPDTAVSRIQKRLQRNTECLSPPSFRFPTPPFSLLSTEVLLSKETLVSTIIVDITYIAQQARLFSEQTNKLSAIDTEYISGVPDLYSNQPRQFHITVPCHSKFSRNHVCNGPATVVFRFDEMTPHPHWEERIKQNRIEHTQLLTSLSLPISCDVCKAVARTEHVVEELSRLSSSRNTEALSSGVALFYELLKFINAETKQFPPTCQFLTSCVEILGQEFIQRDSTQTMNILQLLLTQRALCSFLAPLFQPNNCPDQFITMYSNIVEIAVKEGPHVAFSVLTKFNLTKWLTDATPTNTDLSRLLEQVFHGIELCGLEPSGEICVLLETYVYHMNQLVDHVFPQLYSDTLHHIINRTETASIVPTCWDNLLSLVSPNYSPDNDSCRISLQQVQESLSYVSLHFAQKRRFTQESLYALLHHSYIPYIAKFLQMLTIALIRKTCSSIDIGNINSSEALTSCWRTILEVYCPWIFPFNGDLQDTSVILYPCKVEDTVLLSDMVSQCMDVFTVLQTQFNKYGECALSLIWSYYCYSLALDQTPDHILQCYHGNLINLPWQQYLVDLPAMGLMMQLKMNKSYSSSCFIFLGDIFPLFSWKDIAQHYSSNSDPVVPVQFNINFLQLLVMLAAEPEVMSKKETKVPDLISEAKGYDFHYVDSKTFNDILYWQKNSCQCYDVLQTGSSLSTALRLLKAAASFPTSTEVNKLQYHTDGWEKRHSFIKILVELISSSSHVKDTHNTSYMDIMSFIFQCIIDIVVYEPMSQGSHQLVQLLNEVMNLLNTCTPKENFVVKIVSHINTCLSQLPNAHLICLPTITAACQTVISVHQMVTVVEGAISTHFKSLPPPSHQSLQLPHQDDRYGWSQVVAALTLSDTVTKDFILHCVTECACLGLHAHLMRLFPRCTSIQQEYTIATQVVEWCSNIKPNPTEEHKVLLLWEKALNLILRQIKYGGVVTRMVPLLSTLMSTLQRLGEDKATEGLLGAIGLGKKSCYSQQFRLLARVLSTFMQCQMPLDNAHSVILRLSPNAPGHVKDPNRYQQQATLVTPSKQADQALAGLEGLLSNKNYLDKRDFITYSLEFVTDTRHSLFNILELFIYLVCGLYPTERSLDILRVLQT